MTTLTPTEADPQAFPADLRVAALERLDDAVSIAEVQGPIRFVNHAWSELTGFTDAEILGSSWRDLVAAGNEGSSVAALDATIAQGRPWHGELWMARGEGSAYLARCTVCPVQATVPPTHLVMVQRDITAFRRAAERQRAFEAGFRSLIEHSPDGIAVEHDGEFLYANPALVTYLGYASAEELLHNRVEVIVSPTEREKVLGILTRLAEGKELDGPFEVLLRRADGNLIIAEATAIRTVFEGAPATLTTFRDLSVRRQLETRLVEADRMVSIGTLASGIAHEINTPIQFVGDGAHFLKGAFEDLFRLLNAYRGFAQRVATLHPEEIQSLQEEEDVADADYLETNVPAAVQRTLDGVSRVATIVRAMKEFGHPGVVTPTPADLNKAIQATLTVARNEVKYVADVKEDLGDLPQVVCQIGGMNQVFLNLIVNAAHAISDRVEGTDARGLITITTRREGSNVRISVADTGTGIPEAIRARIFDPFFTTKEVGKGTGQGLAIARNIVVDKHRGSITVDSTPGVGTTFHILLPIEGPGEPR